MSPFDHFAENFSNDVAVVLLTIAFAVILL